jgi:hypothetical protein
MGQKIMFVRMMKNTVTSYCFTDENQHFKCVAVTPRITRSPNKLQLSFEDPSYSESMADKRKEAPSPPENGVLIKRQKHEDKQDTSSALTLSNSSSTGKNVIVGTVKLICQIQLDSLVHNPYK